MRDRSLEVRRLALLVFACFIAGFLAYGFDSLGAIDGKFVVKWLGALSLLVGFGLWHINMAETLWHINRAYERRLHDHGLRPLSQETLHSYDRLDKRHRVVEKIATEIVPNSVFFECLGAVSIALVPKNLGVVISYGLSAVVMADALYRFLPKGGREKLQPLFTWPALIFITIVMGLGIASLVEHELEEISFAIGLCFFWMFALGPKLAQWRIWDLRYFLTFNISGAGYVVWAWIVGEYQLVALEVPASVVLLLCFISAVKARKVHTKLITEYGKLLEEAESKQ